MPAAARIEVRPSPDTSHARPSRGAMLDHRVFMPVRFGNPGSVSKNKPGGALSNRLVWIPCRKAASSK